MYKLLTHKLIMKCLGCASIGTLFASALSPSAQAAPDSITCQAVIPLAQGASLIYQVMGTVPETVTEETSINPVGTSLSLSIQRRDRSGAATTILSNSSLSEYEQIAPDADYSQIPFADSFRAQPNNGQGVYAAPASVHGLYASLRPIHDQPQQMQVVHYLSAGQPMRSEPGNCEVIPSSTESLTEPPLRVVKQATLPPLSAAELSQLSSEGANGIQSWIDIAGLGKVSPPAEFTTALQEIDQQQQAQNPVTAPFLGLWEGEPPASGYPYFLSIFPANEPDQVCIIEYQQGQQIAAEIEPATFTISKATVAQGNLLSPRLRSSQTVSQVQSSYSGTSKFLAVLQPNINHPVRVFSLADHPALHNRYADQSVLYNSFSPRMISQLTKARTELNCEADADDYNLLNE